MFIIIIIIVNIISIIIAIKSKTSFPLSFAKRARGTDILITLSSCSLQHLQLRIPLRLVKARLVSPKACTVFCIVKILAENASASQYISYGHTVVCRPIVLQPLILNSSVHIVTMIMTM